MLLLHQTVSSGTNEETIIVDEIKKTTLERFNLTFPSGERKDRIQVYPPGANLGNYLGIVILGLVNMS